MRYVLLAVLLSIFAAIWMNPIYRSYDKTAGIAKLQNKVSYTETESTFIVKTTDGKVWEVQKTEHPAWIIGVILIGFVVGFYFVFLLVDMGYTDENSGAHKIATIAFSPIFYIKDIMEALVVITKNLNKT